MGNVKQKQPKRPPAHEVILDHLGSARYAIESIQKRRWIEHHEDISVAVHRNSCGDLLDILEEMHLPEQEEPKILAALRRFKPKVIGIHRSHTQLLKRLSRHAPAHARGKE